jgi:hypothetical protein
MVRRSTFSNRAQLSVTQLEAREVPAGGVVAEMYGGTLLITGDNFDNSVTVSGSGIVDDGVTVEGFQTSINGGDAPAFFTGVERVEIIGRSGEDRIWVNPFGSTILETVIDSGSGHDQVFVYTVSRTDVSIATGDGHDYVFVWSSANSTAVGAKLAIDTGAGNDRVLLNLLNHNGSVVVNTGDGADLVEVHVGRIYGDLSINTSNGNDEIHLSAASAIAGDIHGNLSIEGGNGGHDLLVAGFGGVWGLNVDGVIDISGIEIHN